MMTLTTIETVASAPSTTFRIPPQEDAVDKVMMNERMPRPPVFKDKYEEREYLKGRLAAAFRIFGKLGFDEGVAGHITLRDPVDPSTFWVNPFGIAFSMMKRSDLILVDHDGQVIDGGSYRLLNVAAYSIHSAVHAARPDVICAAHSHSIHGRSFCALGRPLDIISQDACVFYKDHVVYQQFNGLVLTKEEGEQIASSMGEKKAVLLQNHGILTVGKTIEEAVYWFSSLERCCQVQLLADAAAAGHGGETVKISDEDAAFTHDIVGTPIAGWFSAKPLFDLIHKETNGEYLE